MSPLAYLGLILLGLLLAFIASRRGGPLRRHQEHPQPADITWPDLGEIIDVPVPSGDEQGTRWIAARFTGSDEQGRAIVQPLEEGYGTEIRTHEWDWQLGEM